MSNRANNFINKSLREKIDSIKVILNSIEQDKREESLYIGIGQLADYMEDLIKKEDSFMDDGTLKEDKAKDYYELCANINTKFDYIESLVSNDKVKKSEKILELYNDIKSWKSELYKEIEEYTKERINVPDFDWELNEEQTNKRDKLMNDWTTYFEPDEEQNHLPHNDAPELLFHNEDEYQNALGPEIKLLGNMKDLASYYAKNESNLTDVQKRYIKGQGQSIAFYEKLGNESRKYKHESVFGVVEKNDNGVNSIELTGYKGQYQHQNSLNGCWSCTLSMMLKSRGISLDQRIIRAYRPPFKYSQTIEKAGDMQVVAITNDSAFTVMDQADLVNKMIPNTGLVTTNFSQLKLLNDVQKNIVANQIKTMVSDTLKNTKTPVAMSIDGHFVTIVGIEGNNLKILDSVEPNIETTRSIASLMNTEGVSFTRLHDLNVTKDKKINNIPETVNYYSSSGFSFKSGVVNDGNIVNIPVGYPSVEQPVVNAEETWYLPDNLVDPDTLQVPKKDESYFFQKKFEINSPEVEDAIKEDKFNLDNVIGGYRNHMNDYSPNAYEPILEEVVARMIVHETLKKEFGKPGLQDKFMLNRALKRTEELSSKLIESSGFKDYFKYLTKEGGVLNTGTNIKYSESNIEEFLYDGYKASVASPTNAVKSVIAQNIPEEKQFDTKIYTDELKEIRAQIGKAVKNLPKKGGEIVKKNLAALTGALDKVSGQFDKYHGAMIEGQGRDFYAEFYPFFKPGHDIMSAVNKEQIPSDAQIQSMKLYRRLDNAVIMASKKLKPEEIAKHKLCEKLLAMQATNLMKSQSKEDRQKGIDLLNNSSIHKVEFDMILNSKTLNDMIKGKNLKELNSLVKSDNQKTYSKFEEAYKAELVKKQQEEQAKREQQANVGQGQPQPQLIQ